MERSTEIMDVARVAIERKPKFITEARPRGRGRPKLEGDVYIEKLATRREELLPKMKRLAENRTKFRKWLNAPTLDGKTGR